MKLRFRVEVEQPFGDRFKALEESTRHFESAAEAAANKAAQTATNASRRQFRSRLVGRPNTEPRRGRPTTMGRFDQYIQWNKDPGLHSVVFDLSIEDKAPYWAIQEIGTNRTGSAVFAWPNGQTTRRVVSVRSQRGRYIAPGLGWGSSGTYHSASGSRRGRDQIHPTARLSIARTGGSNRGRRAGVSRLRTPRVRIRREIKGKHYIREGAEEGYEEYRNLLMRAAENSLRGRRKR